MKASVRCVVQANPCGSPQELPEIQGDSKEEGNEGEEEFHILRPGSTYQTLTYLCPCALLNED